MRLSSQSPMGYFFVNNPFTQTPNPLYWSYYIYYIYIFMLHAKQPPTIQQIVMHRHKTLQLPSLLSYNRLSSWRWASYRDREESASERKINAMDLIKYMSK